MDGFLEYHKFYCEREDCPSKKNLSAQNKNKINLKHIDESEELIKLHFLIDHFYVQTLQKFPNTPRLRISHALFLLDKLNHKQHALTELIAAENDKLSFSEGFIIYRYK